MDEIKTKFLDLIHKQNRHVKIPAMGFSDYFIQNVSSTPDATPKDRKPKSLQSTEDNKMSDQEILEGIERIYFEENADLATYELKKFEQNELTCEKVQESMIVLKQQQKVISKKVLQHILEQRSSCNEEFQRIGDAEKELEEALWVCRKARSYLSYAKKHLTTTSLEILATYRKREILLDLLKSLNAIKILKTTDTELQKLLHDSNYSGAISLLLECKATASEYTQYKCVESLNQKLQETLMLTEFQLDNVLNEMTQNFDAKKYGKLQEAYKLLNKSLIAMDQLHINFISAIHSTVNVVLRSYNEPSSDDKQKQLFEQLCEGVAADKYIQCLINLCKSFWTILVSYYQIVLWHQNYKLFPSDSAECQDSYIQEKLKKGQSRVWNDIQSKLCTYLSSQKLRTLKYEQFIQVLSIIQRLKKVGVEFCGETSNKLLETMRLQSTEFFYRYHVSCLEEICLFLDHEAWVPVDSFTNILQLQEFRSVRHSLQRRKSPTIDQKVAVLTTDDNGAVNGKNHNSDELVSVHSQDGSSIYESCGYFLRFSEKSSPFDGGLDAAMLEEDILSGIVDEASCYFSEESEDDDVKNSFLSKSDDDSDSNVQLFANNTSLNVLRCIGRYLQMCKLLHSISPQIICSIFELIDFYMFAVHELFGKDSPVPMENLYTERLLVKLKYISDQIIVKIKGWPLNFSSLINNELSNPETLYGLSQRIVGIESGICMAKQLQQLHKYLEHLLPASDHQILYDYYQNIDYIYDVSKPIYMCVTSRACDLHGILSTMGKVKWDVNHVSVQHSPYIDTMNRSVQTFAMRMEEISKIVPVPFECVWNSLAHVTTHLLVEGFSNTKKCSPGGRALMQLDFTHFMSILELLSGMKFPQYRNYVDSYVKAYYFPSELLEGWIQEQSERNEYSSKQLSSLINCVCSSDKRMKQKILGFLGNVNENS
ncbi:syndetin isoform X2 [Hermetia illucens]|uniref:syndetin isoform X2 n=1 Tax=Hermetia illucens TaxID=343691 RepID=UPI0018CC34A1|nr:syndetin isoform X2 [Hermetia illucens]